MHGAETQTRALSLRADTLKRCYTRDSQRDSNPQLIPLQDEYNPYATPTAAIVVGVVAVVVVQRFKSRSPITPRLRTHDEPVTSTAALHLP